jgi:hypothetical protein
METENVSETLDFCSKFTQLIIQEDVIAFSHCKTPGVNKLQILEV